MKSLLVNALLLAFGIVVSLVVTEVALRVALPHPQVIEIAADSQGGPRPLVETKPVRVELEESVNEPDGIYLRTSTGRRLRPNAHATIKNHHLCKCTTELRTNSLGYRNREIGEKTRTRVLFLGDSITLADYVQEPETWVRRVEKLSESTPHPLETINAGVWAIGLANELAILLETGLQTDPDAVVLAWYLNDVQASPGVYMIRPPDWAKRSRLAQHAYHGVSMLRSKLVQEDYSTISRETREKWKQETAERFPPGEGDPRTVEGLNRKIQKLFGDWGSAWSDGAWEHMKPYFVELKRQSELHGFRLLFVAFPVRDQVDVDFLYDYPQQKLKEVAAELDVPVLDLLPMLREARAAWEESGGDRELRLFYDWCHHTPYANELIAERVHAFLQEELSS